MKLTGSSKFLGLAVSDRYVLAAQVRVSRDRRDVGPMARFTLPDALTWENPDALGMALRQFLRQNRFSASHAVVGVPARWMLAREKEVPPATPQVAASMLRLQAERDFPQDLELVFDYAGSPDAARPTKVLLAAMPRQHLDRIVRMAEEAGLSLTAVTSSTMALAGAAGAASNGLLSVVLGPDSVELLLRGQSAPRMLKHLPISVGADGGGDGQGAAGSLLVLGSEVQRALAFMPQDGIAPASRTIFLWDGVGLDSGAASALAQRSGLEVRVADDLSALGVAPSRTTGGESRRLGSAVALALAAARSEPASIDFLHARLALPKTRRIGRQTLLGIAAGIFVVGAVAWLLLDIRDQQNMLDKAKQQLDDLKPALKSAQAVADKVRFARGWFETRPPYLACSREVTLAFPLESQIYATVFSFRENGKGQITGKAPDQKSVLLVMDRLKGNKSFSDVKLLDMRDAGGRSREIAFSMSFAYKGLE